MERVWDRFLTERDKAHVALRQRPRKGFGERPALLLIDLYRGVFGDYPQPLLEAVETWPSTCGMAGWDALPAIQRLLECARSRGIPVIHTTGLDESKEYRGIGRQTPSDSAAADRERRRYQIIDQVAPLPGEFVVRKASPSCFWGTPLVGYLTSLGIDTLIVGGESTSGCVRASVVDGSTCRYHVAVVEECVFDRHEACHAVNLFDLHQKYADVLPLDQVLAYLETRSLRHAAPASVASVPASVLSAG